MTNGKLMSLNEEARTFRMKPGEAPPAYVMRARRIGQTLEEFREIP